jgi:hypothetical protein
MALSWQPKLAFAAKPEHSDGTGSVSGSDSEVWGRDRASWPSQIFLARPTLGAAEQWKVDRSMERREKCDSDPSPVPTQSRQVGSVRLREGSRRAGVPSRQAGVLPCQAGARPEPSRQVPGAARSHCKANGGAGEGAGRLRADRLVAGLGVRPKFIQLHLLSLGTTRS